MMHTLGAGYMTLTHGKNVPWADSATDKPAHGGLSPFGEQVVRRDEPAGDAGGPQPRLGRHDGRRPSGPRAPVIFSHSSARALCRRPRNVPDDILKQLPANGGVVMVTFCRASSRRTAATIFAADEA